MPGPYIHISAARQAAQKLSAGGYAPVGSLSLNGNLHIDPGWPGADLAALGQAAVDHPNFTSLGAVGPDLFFFLPDFRDINGVPTSSVLVEVLNFLEGLYAALDPYLTKYEKYLGPIGEDTAEEMSRLTGGLSESVGNISGDLGAILITALEDFAVSQKDWWEYFSLGLNRGYDEQAYLWSDMLHYRETGHFAQLLWQQAEGKDDDRLRAYAAGYLSHVATDTTAHGFVNQISGGPFRLHWQRHHLVENHMDAYWFLRDAGPGSERKTMGFPQLTESALYYDIAFDEGTDDAVSLPNIPSGHTLREVWTRRRLLDIDSKLPDSVSSLLIQTMTDLFYQGGPHPAILRDKDGKRDGRPDDALVGQAYDLLFRFLKLTTVDGFSHEPPPPPDLWPNLDFPTPTDAGSAGDMPPGDDDGDFWDDVLDFILAVIAVIAYILEVAAWLATIVWAVVADIATYPLRLGLYFALELPLASMLKAFRSVLVRSGYMMPMDDEIDQSLIRVGNPTSVTWAQLRDDLDDVFGAMDAQPADELAIFRDKAYPHAHPKDEFRQPWAYPMNETEQCPTTAGPHGRDSGPPQLFRLTAPDPTIRDALETSTGPADSDWVGCTLQPDKHLGDVVSMTEYLVWLATRNRGGDGGGDSPNEGAQPAAMPNFNLDADRGYGYLAWDWNRLPVQSSKKTEDPEGDHFGEPCTWPSQSDFYQMDRALQIHWTGTGHDDPGCVEPECVDCSAPPPIN